VPAVAGGGAESISDAACARAPEHEEQVDIAVLSGVALRQPATVPAAYPLLPFSCIRLATPLSHRPSACCCAALHCI
jgi:hypothetical protein